MFEPHDFMQEPVGNSDLQKLKHEVLDQGPEASLPCNLPDAWLSMLERDLEMLLQKQKEDHNYLTAPLAIIAHILYGKHGNKETEISFSDEELFKYLQDLRIEISLEIIRRNTNITPEPATLDTIFTNRDVHMVEQPFPF